ncbi:MAG TPA: outer membrane beta-barrel protein [Verrucomicrobiae bacterium]|nr:outer membrane beta-barrel protein [Verrucomicrobiae bacterium]
MMKKFIVSVGLVAAGSMSLHADYSPDASDTSKIWSLSGTLRGFYDDNYLTTTKKEGSAGFEVSPSFMLNAPFEQSEIGIRYTYGLYYYQDRERLGLNPIDQSHEFDLWLDHAFTPRWETRFEDSVTVAQEPQLLSTPGTAAAVDNRVEGNNLVNNAMVSLTTDWTELFSTKLSYANTFYDYENSGGNYLSPSLSGLLDRDENLLALNFQWQATDQTMGFVGVQYGQVVFLSSETIAFDPITGQPYDSSTRDNRSEYGYVGATHQFLPNLTGSIEAGVQYTSYYLDPNSSSSFGPYGSASLVYTYAPGSFAEIGATESRNATDVVAVNSAGQITLDQESTVVYGSIDHSITAKLNGSLTADYQYSTYNEGEDNDDPAQLVSIGLNLSYTFSPHLSSEIGYNFDWYHTVVALDQNYNRNRVYLGVTATY